MKLSGISLGLLSVTLAFPVIAADKLSLTQQRETYQEINRLLTISQSEPSQAIAKTLLSQIQDYPLYPYAEYQLLNANKSGLDLTEIENYQQRNPSLPFATRLKAQWLQERQSKQDWQTIINNVTRLPNDKASQCITLQAQIATAKTDKTSTALLQKRLIDLWLTGNSLPKQCDPVLEQWNKQGGLSKDLVQQRAVLAFEQNNTDLLTHLTRQASDESLQAWLKDLNLLAKSPAAIWNKANMFYVEKLSPENPLDKRVLLASYPKYLKTVKENELSFPLVLFEAEDQHSNVAKRFNLTEQQIAQWKNILISQLFDSEIAALQQWRDQQLLLLRDDALFERRIRMAIREKGNIAQWLEQLSPQAKKKDEWIYWQAQVLAKQGKKEQAEHLLRSLQKEPRGFYPMIAAAELGLPYQPEMRELKTTAVKPENATQHNSNKTTAKTESRPEQKYAKELQRINELRYFNDNTNANMEWTNLLGGMSLEQKLQLAQYAQSQQWYDLQVEATIQAKAWMYIGLRLPNAYSDWFDLFLNGKKIERTFAMAIARQESAWKPYVSSSANARGLMQLLPSTAKLTAQKGKLPYNNESQLYDPFINIMLGTAHLQELYDKYGNNRILIAAAYNAGAHRVEQWLKKSAGKLTMAEFIASIPFYETRGYVQNVLAYDAYYQILQNKTLQLFSKEEYDRLY
ncbi:MAG TPA: lytic murein transglycosylase [Pasteurellaceae bacterium]|nr:lytic murein transglycosylase [Pasteurellaceae bacterium]